MSLKLYYGPYEAHGVIRHKLHKLRGLVAELSARGYAIELIATNRLNSLIIHLSDKEIYRCDIRYLMFNMSIEDDPIAQNIIKSIEETRARFDADDNVPSFDMVRRKSSPGMYISEDISLIYNIPNTYSVLKNLK